MKEPEKEETEEEEIDPSDLRDGTYSEEELDKYWKEFTAKFDKEGRHQEVLILKEPFKRTDHKIVVNIPNEALESTFEKFRGDLLSFLRNKLKNDHITISSEVVEVKREKMRYTDREKFDYLKEKYPALRDLQEKLGLDPEF